jgi:hypothetical protein
MVIYMSGMSGKMEEIVPQQLQSFLTDVVDEKFGFKLGAPWKYSEQTLGVVVPILRQSASEREYVTMYEVLKDLGMKDTGHIDQVELQNRTQKAVFVRAGTIFAGSTQPRAAQHSGVYQPGKEEVPVRCVQQTRGINPGSEMKFGDIAPMSVTMNLMSGSQSRVWASVRRYTGGDSDDFSPVREDNTNYAFANRYGGVAFAPRRGGQSGGSRHRFMSQSMCIGGGSSGSTGEGIRFTACAGAPSTAGRGTDDLLGHIQKMKEGQAMLDDMMQRVPLFDTQVGAIIFNPVGVIAVETFDHPMSWAAIKKEIIEKYGDKIMDNQAEHLFELKPEAILPALKKFIKGLEKNTEKTIRKDGFSETRVVMGEGIIGEYTIVKGQTVHVLLIKESGWGA